MMKKHSAFYSCYLLENITLNVKLLFRSIILFLSILIFLPTHAHAAITVDASSYVVVASTTASTASWSHTVGTGNNRILIVGVSLADTSTNFVTGITYGGTALTRIGTGTAASDTLVAVTSPTATKSFSPVAIAVSGASNMTITLINSNTAAITGVTFTDTYPSTNMKNTAASPTSNTCGGAVTMTNGGSSLSLSGGTISA
jgi:hypothetical protein